jgi:hypothetical protein
MMHARTRHCRRHRYGLGQQRFGGDPMTGIDGIRVNGTRSRSSESRLPGSITRGKPSSGLPACSTSGISKTDVAFPGHGRETEIRPVVDTGPASLRDRSVRAESEEPNADAANRPR